MSLDYTPANKWVDFSTPTVELGYGGEDAMPPPQTPGTKVEVKDALDEIRRLMDDVIFAPARLELLEQQKAANAAVCESDVAVEKALENIQGLYGLLYKANAGTKKSTPSSSVPYNSELLVIRSKRGALLISAYDSPLPVQVKDLEK